MENQTNPENTSTESKICTEQVEVENNGKFLKMVLFKSFLKWSIRFQKMN